jgi:hypothetical protein
MNRLHDQKYQSEPNWSSFYCTLVRLGPLTLQNIPKEWVRWFQEDGAATDCFWSEEMEGCLFGLWAESQELAVREALCRYVESVQAMLAEFPYGEDGPGWRTDASSGELLSRSECIAGITSEPVRPIVLRALLEAAQQPA